jgi:hypothetical protein
VTPRANVAMIVAVALALALSVWLTAGYVTGDGGGASPPDDAGSKSNDLRPVNRPRSADDFDPGETEPTAFAVTSPGAVLGRLGEFGFTRVVVLARGRPTKVLAARGEDGELAASTEYRVRGRKVRLSQATGPRSAGRAFVIRYSNDGIRYLPARSWRARGYVVALRPFRRNYRRHVTWLQYLCLAGDKGEGMRCP